jgi:hypothetical protein
VIGYPAWYYGGCPDAEAVLRDLFADLLTGVEVISWMPPDYATKLAAGLSFLRVFRVGGQINVDSKAWVDQTRIQFAALSASRDDSWQLIEFVRQVLYSYRDGGHVITGGATAFIVVPGEVVGPQLIPEQMRDERLVPVTFDVHIDRPKGLPNYRDALNLN